MNLAVSASSANQKQLSKTIITFKSVINFLVFNWNCTWKNALITNDRHVSKNWKGLLLLISKS